MKGIILLAAADTAVYFHVRFFPLLLLFIIIFKIPKVMAGVSKRSQQSCSSAGAAGTHAVRCAAAAARHQALPNTSQRSSQPCEAVQVQQHISTQSSTLRGCTGTATHLNAALNLARLYRYINTSQRSSQPCEAVQVQLHLQCTGSATPQVYRYSNTSSVQVQLHLGSLNLTDYTKI